MLGKYDIVVLTALSRPTAEKLEETISRVCGWVNGRIAKFDFEVILPYDLRSLPSQSTTGPGARLVLGIRPWLGEINLVP